MRTITTTTTTTTATIAVVTAAVVPKMQQVKRSVHNVMYILSLHTRTAVVLVADAHNEVQGIHTVGIICTVIYEYIYKGHVLPHLLRLPQDLVDRACSGSRT